MARGLLRNQTGHCETAACPCAGLLRGASGRANIVAPMPKEAPEATVIVVVPQPMLGSAMVVSAALAACVALVSPGWLLVMAEASAVAMCG